MIIWLGSAGITETYHRFSTHTLTSYTHTHTQTRFHTYIHTTHTNYQHTQTEQFAMSRKMWLKKFYAKTHLNATLHAHFFHRSSWLSFGMENKNLKSTKFFTGLIKKLVISYRSYLFCISLSRIVQNKIIKWRKSIKCIYNFVLFFVLRGYRISRRIFPNSIFNLGTDNFFSKLHRSSVQISDLF